MKKAFPMAVFLAVSLLGWVDSSKLPSLNIAFAKPPPWAPAHGYRRKHGDDDDDQGEDHDRKHEHHDHDDDVRTDSRTENTIRQVVVTRFEEIFRRLDINRDGRISRSEFEEGDSLFDRLDRNHDGVLTRDEYDHIDEQRGLFSGILFKIKDKLASLWNKLW